MRHRGVAILMGVILLALVAPAQASIDTGFDPNVDFARLQTYSWKDSGGQEAPNPMTEKRIHMAVDKELAAKGLKKVEAGADLLVMTAASSSTLDRTNAEAYGVTPNNWFGFIPSGHTVGGSYKGALVVSLIDPRTGKLVWQGIAHENLGVDPNPEKIGKKVFEVVGKMFEKFPPPKK